MPRLRVAAALFLLAPVAVAACGGKDPANPADAGPTPTVSEADARRTEVAQGLEQPVPPDRPLPSPTPLPDGVPVLQVVAGDRQFTPTRQEFEALPTATITAGGKQYTGVTLAELAKRTSAPDGATVTIQGTRMDNLRYGAIRYPLAEVAAGTVIYLDQSGHPALASATIPQEQWLHTLTGIAFQ